MQRVVLVRAGTVTHNFNADQRHLTLDFRRDGGDVLLARVPDEPAVAVVGYYLLFVIDSTGRPSTGRFVQICASARSRWRSPGSDDEWWSRLRELAGEEGRPGPAELRRLRRDLLGRGEPPRRRPLSTEPHGPGDQGGHGGHGGGDTTTVVTTAGMTMVTTQTAIEATHRAEARSCVRREQTA